VKNTRLTHAPETPASEAIAPRKGFGSSWTSFWFSPADPIALHIVRVLAGLVFLGWLLPFAGDVEAFFGQNGWFDLTALKAYRDADRPPEGAPVPITWSLLYTVWSDPARLEGVYWASVVVVTLFTIGLWTRVTGVLTWLAVTSFVVNPAITYDADNLLIILAFYLMLGYLLLGQWSGDLSIFGRLLGTRDTLLLPGLGRRVDAGGRPRPGSYAANLAMRLLQVHFAIVIVVSGLHKLQFGQWWGGVAFWYPLHPALEATPESIRAEAARPLTYLAFLSLAQYIMLAWELGFPLFAWRRGLWRLVLLGGAVVGWVGSLVIFHQPLFGPIFFVACLSYISPAEWRAAAGLLGRLLPLPREARQRPEVTEPQLKVVTKA
jgi:hypothetical protein